MVTQPFPHRLDIYLVDLDPTVGSEISKSRPCLVVSPNEMNRRIATVIVAPLTSGIKGYPTRVRSEFQGREGEIALDQLRTVDKSRLVRRFGALDRTTSQRVFEVLAEMFAP